MQTPRKFLRAMGPMQWAAAVYVMHMYLNSTVIFLRPSQMPLDQTLWALGFVEVQHITKFESLLLYCGRHRLPGAAVLTWNTSDLFQRDGCNKLPTASYQYYWAEVHSWCFQRTTRSESSFSPVLSSPNISNAWNRTLFTSLEIRSETESSL